jgi:hypothetical protein
VYLNLDKSIKRLLPNASLSLSDYVRYTPTAPGFSAPLAGTSPGSPVNIQNVYAQGLLTSRVNNVVNTANASGSYTITPLTSLNASYSYMILQFGSSPITQTTQLFDTTTHNGTVGAKTQVTALDSLLVNYSYSQSELVPHASTASTAQTFAQLFRSQSATLGWSRIFTPSITAQVGGGIIVIDPGITTYAMNASMVLNTPNNIATISYNRSAYPGFLGVPVPLISDVLSLSAIQKLALDWELNETATFSHLASAGSGPVAITYNSYFAGIDLYYWITTMWSTALSFDYMNFDSETAGVKSNFDRYAVTFSIKATLK